MESYQVLQINLADKLSRNEAPVTIILMSSDPKKVHDISYFDFPSF